MTQINLVQRLNSTEPGWTINADVIVIGSGIAGLTAALSARAKGLSVLLLTKDVLSTSSTSWAQGGIAAALGPGDSPDQHFQDTLEAGAGLCDQDSVKILVQEGPAAVRRLINLGATFDLDSAGNVALTREGGHRRHRIAHAGGDATGAEISRALVAKVLADPKVRIFEHALVLDLLKDKFERVCGVTLHVMGKGRIDGVGAALARAVILATGGLGAVFEQTTNPLVATGDGVALALRAGTTVADLEFVQFHPTVLWVGPDSRGSQPLISEAVRGEGAILRNINGEAFMSKIHPMKDLAPRDVVAHAVHEEIIKSGKPFVYLDGTKLGKDIWLNRFPNILLSCQEIGIDPLVEMIPVVPAAHYASGGVISDMTGRTDIPGLFAVGECASTGVHGANRLASNSLLEGLVVAERIAQHLIDLPAQSEPLIDNIPSNLIDGKARKEITATTTKGAGAVRNSQGLQQTINNLAQLATKTTNLASTQSWEATNLLTVSSFLSNAALRREESRGSHWRTDFPARNDERWLVRIQGKLNEGKLELSEKAIGKK
ncbi:MAG: L-aspartate oxidase [Candidatus Nanopelagicales bacterium]|jgi:L-aspartate oxidase|nr:L-aspartate oxidase [Candidatus Nanopelagicales bacterium]